MGNFAENLNLGNRVRPPPQKVTSFCQESINDPSYDPLKQQIHNQG